MDYQRLRLQGYLRLIIFRFDAGTGVNSIHRLEVALLKDLYV
ncbi:hypothetical protein [Kaarinaea lacus]